MYETRFGLRRRPFRATPDLDSYYPATSHECALARLLQAIADDEGLALLTGDVGMGKTLIGHCLLDRLGSTASTAFLTNSHLGGRAGLLQAILYDFSLPYQGLSEQELRLALTDFLLKNYAAGRRTVVILDEAQHLPADLLEELRLLGNLEARGGKAFQAVLLGQPALLETLRRPELAAFNQRLTVRLRLDPLGLDEAVDYLLHQLRIAGGRPQAIVSDEALQILAAGARGVPRLLNQAAHQALLLADAAGADLVDAEAAMEALALLGLDVETGSTPEECCIRAVDEEDREGPGAALAEPTNPVPDDPPVVLAPVEPDEPSCRLFDSPRRPA
ncbi:MAG TPA: AAA family ATPase [Gemmataceae bacterium]|nr:AAA family ATPase [Gemmataceae bacterium]